MRKNRFPVFVDTASQRVPARFFASGGDEPASIALRLREKGWAPYRVRFDENTGAWIASVIDWRKAA